MKKLLIVSLLISMAACSSNSRPKLYPNQTLKENGEQKAQADINECMAKTDAYFKTDEGKKVANSSGYGSTVGGSVGFGFGTGGSGAGVGVGVGTGRTMSSGDIKRSFTNQCLLDKGYQILAWD